MNQLAHVKDRTVLLSAAAWLWGVALVPCMLLTVYHALSVLPQHLTWAGEVGLLLVFIFGTRGSWLAALGLMAWHGMGASAMWREPTGWLAVLALMTTYWVGQLCFDYMQAAWQELLTDRENRPQQEAALRELQQQSDLQQQKAEAASTRIQELEGELAAKQEAVTLVTQEITWLHARKEAMMNQVQVTHPKQLASDDLVTLQREKARAEGLHKQLRMQFEEKNLQLNQTRQQLFRVEGVCERLRREHSVDEFYSHEEVLHLMAYANELHQQLTASEQEIKDLESLLTILVR